MPLPTPKAIIFDWDNTLVNTWPIIHAALEQTFIEMGREPWTFEQTKARVRQSLRDSFPTLFGDQWQKASDLYQRHYRKHHLAQLEPLPLALDVLERLKNKGIPAIVVSNKKGPNLRKEIDHLCWNDYFYSVVGADDAPNDKPHTDPVHMAFEKSHLKPGSDVWFIGDSDIDLHCALNTGCTAILYGDVKDHPELTATHFLGFPYQAHVKDHTETLALLA